MWKTGWLRYTIACLQVLLLCGGTLRAQLEFESQPIEYGKRFTSDRVSELGAKLASGEIKLQENGKQGWLAAVLKALDVPEASQTLVFSKTSFQLHKISAGRPAPSISTTIPTSVGCKAAM